MRITTSVTAAAICRRGGGCPSAASRADAGHAAEPASGISRTSSQLTFGGDNAEAYFSRDGKRLIFQSTRDGRTCDQQYVMNVDGIDVKRVSTGGGKTTCGYFFDGDRKIFFGSTHAADTACPPKPDPSKGYVWGLDPYDIYTANPDGSGLKRLTNYGVYTAEGTLSPDGQDDRVHVAQGRRPRHLHDECRRHEREAADASSRATTAVRSSRTTARRSSIAPGTRPTRRSRTTRSCSSSASCGPTAWRSGS